MQDMLNSLKRRLLPQCELFSSGMWRLRFDCGCHVGFLAVGDTPVSRGRDLRQARGGLAPPSEGGASQ